MSLPTQQKQYRVKSKTGNFRECLVQETVPLPTVGDSDVLVKIHAMSLNSRDVMIVKDEYPTASNDTPIPVSDGAGEVVAVGKSVTKWKVGDRVMPILMQTFIAGVVETELTLSCLGGQADGVAREYAAFNEQGLVHMPKGWSYEQAATLPCAALTAWNALFGLEGRKLGPGEWVLTQGTGGVSIFALQFAKLVGARVIATTSSEDKAEKLKKLGADEIINYRETPEWSVPAVKISGTGVHHVVEVGGAGTLAQSIKSVRRDGVVEVIGVLADAGSDTPSALAAFYSTAILRGIYGGSRLQLEAMVAAIDANGLEPVVDDKVFEFDQLVEAYEYLQAQAHFGKVVIRV